MTTFLTLATNTKWMVLTVAGKTNIVRLLNYRLMTEHSHTVETSYNNTMSCNLNLYRYPGAHLVGRGK